MYNWIYYVVAVVVLVIVVVTIFFVKNKNDKKRYERLHNQAQEKRVEEELQTTQVEEQEIEKNDSVVEKVSPLMEDFSFEDENKQQTEKKFSINPFELPDDDEDEDDIDEDFDDDKFKEYEEFLRKNLNLDDDDDDENDVEDETLDESFEELSDIDFNKFKGKTRSEVEKMIKNLPQKAQEIILTDILARKDFDDDDE